MCSSRDWREHPALFLGRCGRKAGIWIKKCASDWLQILIKHPPRPPQTPSKAGLSKRGELEIEIKNPFKV
jgi:hypothetical protein